jgi:hypothetical protein
MGESLRYCKPEGERKKIHLKGIFAALSMIK